MRQPIKKISRVPRYQNGEKLSGTAIFRVKSPHIGGDLERVDVSFSSFLCAREKDITTQGFSPAKYYPAGLQPCKTKRKFLNYFNYEMVNN